MLMLRLLLILFILLLLSCGENPEAKLLAQKKAEEIERENARKTEVEFEVKLKAEYEKRFGIPISNFEFSIKSVKYNYYDHYATMSITRTATGAIAKYTEIELELDMDEWLDFVNALHKCNIGEKQFSNARRMDGTFDYVNEDVRELEILLSSSKKLWFGFQPKSQKYEDWADVAEIMDSMTVSIIKKMAAEIEPKLESEYEKKFGVPISDFERSISGMYFDSYEHPNYLYISIYRTATGANIKYSDKAQSTAPKRNLNIDIGEWLDFVNTLYKYNVNKWKEEYINTDKASHISSMWNIHIYSLGKQTLHRSGVRGYPPNWDEFFKVMTDLEAKIKAKAEPPQQALDGGS